MKDSPMTNDDKAVERVPLAEIIKDLDEVVVELARRGHSPCIFLHRVPQAEIPDTLHPDFTIFPLKVPNRFLGFFRRTFATRSTTKPQQPQNENGDQKV